MEPKFDREIKTRPLDKDDYEILKDSVRHVDEHGVPQGLRCGNLYLAKGDTLSVTYSLKVK